MRTLFLQLLLFTLMPARASDSAIQCPGQNTVEIRHCASQQWEQSQQELEEQLPPQTLENWKKAASEACAAAYAPYRQGTIYAQMVIGCHERLNRLLSDELKGLGR